MWEARDGRLLYTSSPLATPGSVSLLADGERLLMDLREGKGDISHVAPMTGMQIIRLSDGKELTRIRVKPEDPTHTLDACRAFSPDDRRILLEERVKPGSAGAKTRLSLYEWESGRRIWSQDLGTGEYPHEVQFLPGGDRLLVRAMSFAKGYILILLDARDGRRLTSQLLPGTLGLFYIGQRTMTSSALPFRLGPAHPRDRVRPRSTRRGR